MHRDFSVSYNEKLYKDNDCFPMYRDFLYKKLKKFYHLYKERRQKIVLQFGEIFKKLFFHMEVEEMQDVFFSDISHMKIENISHRIV